MNSLTLPSTNPLIPRRILFGNPAKDSPKLSPDGTFLAYLAPDSRGTLNVWVRRAGQKDDRVVTSDHQRGIRFFIWQYDSRHILYIQDRDGDENWHLYQTHIFTRETRDLTPLEGIQVRVVAYEPQFPSKMLVAINDRDPSLHDVLLLDLNNGRLGRRIKNTGDISSWEADHQLRVRAGAVFEPHGGTAIRLRPPDSSKWKNLISWDPNETFGGIVGFSPDNRHLRIITSLGANAARLIEIDCATGSTRVLCEDPRFDVSDVLIDPKTHTLLAARFIKERAEYQLLDPSIEHAFRSVQEFTEGDFQIVSTDLRNRRWIVGYTSDDAPTRYFLYCRDNREFYFLFHTRPELRHYPLARTLPISFRARDGMQIYGYITLPLEGNLRDVPLVLLVHGGPWARDTWGFQPEVQWLANRGYIVLQINYRGSTGYGKDYLNAGDREWAGKMQDDLIDGKRWALGQGYGNKDRVAIYGGSYGGYATLVGLTFTPEEFTCGIDIVGPSNLVSLIRSIPPYWKPMKSLFDKRVGTLESEEFLKARSPLFKADQIRRPLLIAQGANDPRVKKTESDQIVDAMRKNQKPVDYLVFPDEGHGFARPDNRLKFYAAAEAFLARYLGGRVEPAGAGETWGELTS